MSSGGSGARYGWADVLGFAPPDEPLAELGAGVTVVVAVIVAVVVAGVVVLAVDDAVVVDDELE